MSVADQTNPQHEYHLSLGSNIDPKINLRKAIELLKNHGEVRKTSSIWKSKAVGSDGPDFLNAIVLFVSFLNANDLIHNTLREIEKELGRVRSSDKNAPRQIDIDILIHNGVEIDASIWDNPYLAVPLAEIIPKYNNPVSGVSINHVAEEYLNGDVIWLESALKHP